MSCITPSALNRTLPSVYGNGDTRQQTRDVPRPPSLGPMYRQAPLTSPAAAISSSSTSSSAPVVVDNLVSGPAAETLKKMAAMHRSLYESSDTGVHSETSLPGDDLPSSSSSSWLPARRSRINTFITFVANIFLIASLRRNAIHPYLHACSSK